MQPLKIFLCLDLDKIETNEQYFAIVHYVEEYLAKKFKVSKSSIHISSIWGMYIDTNFKGNTEMYLTGYTLQLMSKCQYFVYFQRYSGDIMPNKYKILSDLWKEFTGEDVITVTELD